MIEDQFHITKTLPYVTFIICVNYVASYVIYNYCQLVSCPNVTVQRSARCGGTMFVSLAGMSAFMLNICSVYPVK